jgi:hypothetical protein
MYCFNAQVQMAKAAAAACSGAKDVKDAPAKGGADVCPLCEPEESEVVVKTIHRMAMIQFVGIASTAHNTPLTEIVENLKSTWEVLAATYKEKSSTGREWSKEQAQVHFEVHMGAHVLCLLNEVVVLCRIVHFLESRPLRDTNLITKTKKVLIQAIIHLNIEADRQNASLKKLDDDAKTANV